MLTVLLVTWNKLSFLSEEIETFKLDLSITPILHKFYESCLCIGVEEN